MYSSAIRFLLVGAVLWCCVAPGVGQEAARWDVGIRDGYLRGIGSADIWTAADAIGVKQIEVSIGQDLSLRNVFEGSETPYSLRSAAEIEQVKDVFREKGKEICAFAAGYRIGGDRSESNAVERLGRIAEAAQVLEVPVIMVPVPGGKGMSDAAFIEKGKSFLQQLVPIAERTGVHFGLENLQLFWNRTEVLLPVLESLPPDKVGLSHDVVNMYWYGHPLDDIYPMTRRVAPYVRQYCHAKNNDHPEDQENVLRKPPGTGYRETATSIRTGDIDFRLILDIYAEAGFQGVITIEDDSLRKHDAEGRREVLIDDVKYLREIILELEEKY